jgi:hypothetical protein
MLGHTVVSFRSTLVWGISRRLQFGPTVSGPGGFVEYSNAFSVPRSASLEKSRSDNLGIGDSDSLANFEQATSTSSRTSGRGRRLSVYSRPFPGSSLRLKDLPGIKSFFVPAFIATILVVWPILQTGERFSWLDLTIFTWCFLVLGINSLVFDLRDIAGDRLHGTPTIPARLGGRLTGLLLLALGASMVFLSECLGLPGDLRRTLSLALAGVHVAIMVAIICRAKPILLSFLADLLLLTPAFLIGLFRWR